MKELTTNLNDWLKVNIPDLKNAFQDGAGLEEINKLEKKLEVQLPEDFKMFYMLHNGQSVEAPYITPWGELLSLEGIESEWEIWKDLVDDNAFQNSFSEPEKGIKNDWYNTKWIPFTYDGAGNHLCIDLDPTETGKKGQVITMWHDSAEREFIATSFKEWLAVFVDQLKNNYFRYDIEYGCLEHLK